MNQLSLLKPKMYRNEICLDSQIAVSFAYRVTRSFYGRKWPVLGFRLSSSS